jgi:hypothetical protein
VGESTTVSIETVTGLRTISVCVKFIGCNLRVLIFGHVLIGGSQNIIP